MTVPCVWYELDKINYQNENIKIAGVPEHFNLHLAIENKEFKSHDINFNGLMFLKERENVSNAGQTDIAVINRRYRERYRCWKSK
jgi:hypothetical protein